MAVSAFDGFLDSSGLMLFAPVQVAHGQLASGSILASVRDSTGAVMQAVIVSAKNVDSGARAHRDDGQHG